MLKKRTIEEINAYYDGVQNGILMYAWEKDGVYYVGATGTTWKEAQAKMEKARQLALSQFFEKK